MPTNFTQDWVVLDNRGNLDPAINLAIEEFAVRHLPENHSYFFIYRNHPSVIIGRHQHILLEVNLPFCWQNEIPVFRRISGGGTVFHDEGNLNLSFITRYSLKNFNQYRAFLEPVVEYFKSIGIQLTIDPRNNLRLGSKKVSGNAQFTSRNRMLSHGTLLINSDLKKLKQTLKKPRSLQVKIESRATSSVRSSVTNIAVKSPGLPEAEQIAEGLKEAIGGRNFKIYQFSGSEWQQILHLADTKYQSWSWTVAESPPLKMEKTIRLDSEIIRWRYELEAGVFTNVEIFSEEFGFLKEIFEGEKLSVDLWSKIKSVLENVPDKQKQKTEQLMKYWF